ncbi:hypothetical protein BE04_02895 [Sorangium cellulosum]|nr:hypothetical protein BE04_02895 [Sorangium cellulosum]
MKSLARFLTVLGLATCPLLAVETASAQSFVPAPAYQYIPALGANFIPSAFPRPGARIDVIYAGSPLLRMWSTTMGYFHADPRDYIVSLNGIPITDRFHLARVVSGLRGWVPISVEDHLTGVVYPGSVLLP